MRLQHDSSLQLALLMHPRASRAAALRPQIACLTGLVEARVANATAQGRPANFDEWILRVMGRGIADLFMRPYNFKVPARMCACARADARDA